MFFKFSCLLGRRQCHRTQPVPCRAKAALARIAVLASGTTGLLAAGSMLAALSTLAAITQSCTVLENRSKCPCTLYLDMSDPRNGICDTLVVNLWSPDGFSSAIPVPKAQYQQEHAITIPSRHGVNVFVVESTVAARYMGGSNGGITIPLGEQCPSTYMYSSFRETNGESCVDTVKVCKNYCGVTLNFISNDIEVYDIDVSGNVNGYSSSGYPIQGEFRYSPSAGNICYFRLPRQLDGSLKLSLSVPGGREKIFSLGQYILQSGYDWTKQDLEDIAVTIDYASTTLIITIDNWSTTIEYDVIV